MTVFAVEKRPASNSQPSFTDEDDTTPDLTPDTSDQDRMVKETAKPGSSVGNPVVASDADNDPLLYDPGQGSLSTDFDGLPDPTS